MSWVCKSWGHPVCAQKIIMVGKIRFSGAWKVVLLKASSGEHCVLLEALQGTLICVPRAPDEIHYGKMKQCNNILQFSHVRTEKLSKNRKPRLCFPRWTVYNLAMLITEWAVVIDASNLPNLSYPKCFSNLFKYFPLRHVGIHKHSF